MQVTTFVLELTYRKHKLDMLVCVSRLCYDKCETAADFFFLATIDDASRYISAITVSYVITNDPISLSSFFFLQCCSMEVNCETMAVIAATMANGGTCPITRERVVQPEAVRDVLSLLHSCGFYEYSGQFAFKVRALNVVTPFFVLSTNYCRREEKRAIVNPPYAMIICARVSPRTLSLLFCRREILPHSLSSC